MLKKNETARDVARAVAENFDKLPENTRNTLLPELSKKEDAAKIVKTIIKDHSHEFPENIRNLGESI